MRKKKIKKNCYELPLRRQNQYQNEDCLLIQMTVLRCWLEINSNIFVKNNPKDRNIGYPSVTLPYAPVHKMTRLSKLLSSMYALGQFNVGIVIFH